MGVHHDPLAAGFMRLGVDFDVSVHSFAPPGPLTRSKMDALVRAVPAGDMAKLAADAVRLIDLRDDPVVQIQVLPLRHLRQALPAKIFDGYKSLFIHPIASSPSIMSSTMR